MLWIVTGIESSRKIREAKTWQLLWSNGIDEMPRPWAEKKRNRPKCFFLEIYEIIPKEMLSVAVGYAIFRVLVNF